MSKPAYISREINGSFLPNLTKMMNDVQGAAKRFAETTPAVTLGVFTLNVSVFVVGLVHSFNISNLCMLPAAFITSEGLLRALPRIVTSPFLHASFLHILFNGMALLQMGRALEPALGSLLFLWLQVMFGIITAVVNVAVSLGVVRPPRVPTSGQWRRIL